MKTQTGSLSGYMYIPSLLYANISIQNDTLGIPQKISQFSALLGHIVIKTPKIQTETEKNVEKELYIY